jgi:hypothetical protein
MQIRAENINTFYVKISMIKDGRAAAVIMLALVSITLLALLALDTESDMSVMHKIYADFISTNGKTSSDSDSNIYKDTIIPVIAVVIASIAILWNIINYLKQRSGYLELQLECKYECNVNRKYIVSKVSLDNTSTKPIYYVYTFLIIVEQDIGKVRIQKLINDALSEMNDLLLEYNRKGRNIVDNGQNKALLYKIFDLISRNRNNSQESNRGILEDKSTIKFLPYFTMHTRLGSLAHMSATHIHEISNIGIYSVYFVVIGEEWYKNKGSSQATYARAVHDEVIVK